MNGKNAVTRLDAPAYSVAPLLRTARPRRRAAPKATLYHVAWHLSPTQLVAADARCPICDSPIPRQPVGTIQRDPDVRLLQCSHCHACSASHMPTPEVLDEYYRAYFPEDGPKTTMPRVAAFVRGLLRDVPSDELPPHVRILDFGGGDGTLGLALAHTLLAERNDRTVAFTLVDYQQPVADPFDARLDVTHRRTLDELDGKFDLVLASAVLEHIPELRSVLMRLLSVLAPGGSFYARTPWMAPLKRLLPSLDLTYPGHVHDLGAAFWNRVPETFSQPLQLVASRPALIETCWRQQLARTAVAWLMKLPARIEVALTTEPRVPLWRLVGGWEVVLRRSRAK